MMQALTPSGLALLIAAVPPTPPPDWERRHLLRSPDLLKLVEGKLTMEQALNSPSLELALEALAHADSGSDATAARLLQPFEQVPPVATTTVPTGW